MTDKIKHYTQSIHYELEQTARLMKILGVQLFERLQFDLSMDEYVALDTISLYENICQRDLAKLIIKDRASTGRILNGLESKGLIQRLIDTKNNRLVKKVSILEEGKQKLKNINDKIITYFKATTIKISEEKIEIAHLALKQLRQELETFVTINI